MPRDGSSGGRTGYGEGQQIDEALPTTTTHAAAKASCLPTILDIHGT